MKKIFITFFILIPLLLLVSCVKPQPILNLNIKHIAMKLTSPAFTQNNFIPAKYTCDGENINPTLLINDVPPKAQSLALIMDDPDAPMGTWVHWLVWNIDPKIKEIAENSVPADAIEGLTSFGKTGYGGPCPPSGTHRYFFKLYALDKKIDLTSKSKKDDLEKTIQGHIIDQAELVGLYRR
jgi:hypothetical protein